MTVKTAHPKDWRKVALVVITTSQRSNQDWEVEKLQNESRSVMQKVCSANLPACNLDLVVNGWKNKIRQSIPVYFAFFRIWKKAGRYKRDYMWYIRVEMDLSHATKVSEWSRGKHRSSGRSWRLVAWWRYVGILNTIYWRRQLIQWMWNKNPLYNTTWYMYRLILSNCCKWTRKKTEIEAKRNNTN